MLSCVHRSFPDGFIGEAVIVFKDSTASSDHVVAFDRACTMEEELGHSARFVTPEVFANWKEKKVMWGRQKLLKQVAVVGERLKAEQKQRRTEHVQQLAREREQLNHDNSALRVEKERKVEELEVQKKARAEADEIAAYAHPRISHLHPP